MKKTITLATVAIATALVLSACSSEPSGPVTGTAAAKSDVTTSAAPTSTPTPDRPQAGTRDNPFPLNTPGQYDDTSMWTVTVTGTNGDAWGDLQRENPYNTAPESGYSDVLGNLTVGAGDDAPAEGADPGASLNVSYVGTDGNSYDTINYPCGGDMPGTALQEAGVMYAKASRPVTVCAQVPTAAVTGGTWNVTSVLDSTMAAFFAGAR